MAGRVYHRIHVVFMSKALLDKKVLTGSSCCRYFILILKTKTLTFTWQMVEGPDLWHRRDSAVYLVLNCRRLNRRGAMKSSQAKARVIRWWKMIFPKH